MKNFLLVLMFALLLLAVLGATPNSLTINGHPVTVITTGPGLKVSCNSAGSCYIAGELPANENLR